MSHLFGDLLTQHLHRKHGLSQSLMAAGIVQEPAVISKMCKGQRLNGPQARARVVAIIGWLRQHGVLETTSEANALLDAAGMSSLSQVAPAEAALLRQLVAPHANRASAATPLQSARSSLPTTSEYPLIGRQVEWRTLQSAWTKAQFGEAHFVCISGEAGIGKSRLAAELLADVQRQGCIAAQTRAYALEGRLAYAPIADWLRSGPFAASVSVLNAVWRSEIARLLPELLIADPTLPRPQPMTEHWQLKNMFEALLHAFRAVALSQPTLLVLDDLQWCDPETFDWLQYLFSEAPQLQLLIAGTVRDTEVDADHPLHKLQRMLLRSDQITQLSLKPLSQAETGSLAAEVARRPLDGSVATSLFDDCAGNPLFVIETVRFQQGQEHPEPAIAAQRNGSNPLPPKVYAVIQARLARLLPEARAVAELAAVFGRAFTLELLIQASGRSEDEVVQGMDELYRHRLLRSQGAVQHDFSHDRVRDVAYAEISPLRRVLLHQAVARTLEAAHAEDLESVAGELAGHCLQAGALEQALAYYRRAAAVAQHLYAHSEVIRNLERAIAVAQMAPENSKLAMTEIDLWRELGDARVWIHGYGNEAVGVAWSKLYELAMQKGTLSQRFEATSYISSFMRNRGEWRKSFDYLQSGLSLAETSGDRYLLAKALSQHGTWHFHSGELQQSLEHFRRAVALAATPAETPTKEEWPILRDWLLIRMSLCLWLLGYPDQAVRTVESGLEGVNARSDFTDHFGTFDFSAQFFTYMRDVDRVYRLGESLADASNKYAFPFFQCSGKFYRGWALAHMGDAKEGAMLVREGVNGYRRHGSRMLEPYSRAILAEALALAGEHAEAMQEVDAALAFADEKGNVYWNAQLLKLKGDYLQTLGAPDCAVEECYQRALTLAQSQHARSLELRAAMGLARLWQKVGRRTEAYHVLAECYNWFTEGFETADLGDAGAQLAALRPNEG